MITPKKIEEPNLLLKLANPNWGIIEKFCEIIQRIF
jgi:hypothetical protein